MPFPQVYSSVKLCTFLTIVPIIILKFSNSESYLPLFLVRPRGVPVAYIAFSKGGAHYCLKFFCSKNFASFMKEKFISIDSKSSETCSKEKKRCVRFSEGGGGEGGLVSSLSISRKLPQKFLCRWKKYLRRFKIIWTVL